jgi:bifunctional non-homologous end joining protein LigD
MVRKAAGRKLQNEESGGDEIAGVHLTHPDRVLYAQQGITKRELALYYKAIADWILPQVENRPLTLLRCPEGYGKECFYQRHTRDVIHGAIHSITIRDGKASAAYLYIDSLSGLIALVQMGVLEIHTWGSRKDRLERPDRLIFDLDPDPSLPWRRLKEAGETLRSLLSDLGLTAFVKTTGGKGLHIAVPIVPKQDWEFAKDFSKSIAERMVQIAPDQHIATMSKARRAGKIFIDYLRNARTATAVCAYSPRARSGAPRINAVTLARTNRRRAHEFHRPRTSRAPSARSLGGLRESSRKPEQSHAAQAVDAYFKVQKVQHHLPVQHL